MKTEMENEVVIYLCTITTPKKNQYIVQNYQINTDTVQYAVRQDILHLA